MSLQSNLLQSIYNQIQAHLLFSFIWVIFLHNWKSQCECITNLCTSVCPSHLRLSPGKKNSNSKSDLKLIYVHNSDFLRTICLSHDFYCNNRNFHYIIKRHFYKQAWRQWWYMQKRLLTSFTCTQGVIEAWGHWQKRA